MSKRAIGGACLVIVLLGVGSLMGWAYARGLYAARVHALRARVDSTDAYWQPRYSADSAAWARARDSLSTVAAGLRGRRDSLKRVGAAAEAARAAAVAGVGAAETSGDTTALLGALRRAVTETDAARRTCLARAAVLDSLVTACAARARGDSTHIVALQLLSARYASERDSALALLRPPPLISPVLEVTAGPAAVFVPGAGRVYLGVGVQVSVLRFRIPLFGR